MHGSLLYPNFFYSMSILKIIIKPSYGKQFCWHLVKMGRNSNEIVLYHDFLKCNKQLAGCYPHLCKMPCLISVFRTVHHRSPFRAKEMQSTYSKTTFQSTFQYYPSINGCDFQKVSCLQNCNINFKCHMPPKICHTAGNN